MRWILSMTLSVLLAAICGCEDTKCEPCPEDNGVIVCKVWEGVYYGEMVGQASGCGDASALDTDIRVEVSGIEKDPQDEEVTLIEMELTDGDGHWTPFSGYVCNTEDEKEPRTYTFYVTYSETIVDENEYQVTLYNIISGFFIEADEKNEAPRHLEANYNISLTVAQEPDANCNMRASLRAE